MCVRSIMMNSENTFSQTDYEDLPDGTEQCQQVEKMNLTAEKKQAVAQGKHKYPVRSAQKS